MRLYGILLSPFVRTCFVTAHEVGLSGKVIHEPESVTPTAPNPRLVALSPIGKVPVLETDHGHAIYDSRVIVEYLCHVAGNTSLIPDDGVKRFRVLTLQALAMGLGDAAVALRYETAVRPEGLRWDDWADRLKSRIIAACDELESKWQAELADITAGSIAAAVVLSYISFRLPDMKWQDGRPHLAAFHASFAKRDSMVKTRIDG
jgi:glutathione S-transferase